MSQIHSHSILDIGKFLDEHKVHKEYRVHYFLSQMCLLKERYAYTYISVF